EPSRHLVSETMRRISAAYNELDPNAEEQLEDDPSPGAVKEAMEKLSNEDAFEKMADALVVIGGDFCKGPPRLESVEALSWNRFMAFFGYIMENMLSPEASKPGTNDTPKRLRSV